MGWSYEERELIIIKETVIQVRCPECEEALVTLHGSVEVDVIALRGTCTKCGAKLKIFYIITTVWSK